MGDMKQSDKYLLIGVLVLFLAFTPRVVSNREVRGIRNNNPGNIKINPNNKWLGKIPENRNTDGVFEQFENMDFGIRASLVLMKNYFNKKGLRTIKGVIYKWSTTDQQPYTDFVEQSTGIDQNKTLSVNQIPAIAEAIFHFENRTPNHMGKYIFLNQINSVWNSLQ